jgi:formylmethanofuran dehydrogenase subunit E
METKTVMIGGKISGAQTVLSAPPRPSPHHAEWSRVDMATDKPTPSRLYTPGAQIRCHKCGLETVLTEARWKRREYQCGECIAERNRAMYARRSDHYKQQTKAWREKNREKHLASDKAYRARPEERRKHYARVSLKKAIKRGRVTKMPCEKCGSALSQAHHSDYSRRWDVQWLCQPCHAKEHRGQRIGSVRRKPS